MIRQATDGSFWISKNEPIPEGWETDPFWEKEEISINRMIRISPIPIDCPGGCGASFDQFELKKLIMQITDCYCPFCYQQGKITNLRTIFIK